MLDELRKKPKEVRNRYAFFGAVTIAGLIGLVWLVSLPSRLAKHDQVLSVEPDVQGVFSDFFGDIRSSAANTIDSLRAGPEGTNQVDTESPGLVVEPASSTSSIQSEKPAQFGWATTSAETTSNEQQILIATSSKTVEKDAGEE